jgi:hypothetical protein
MIGRRLRVLGVVRLLARLWGRVRLDAAGAEGYWQNLFGLQVSPADMNQALH